MVIVIFIGGLLVLVEALLSDKEILLDSQPSSIESGFEKLWHVMYISSPFFMLAVLFVLFDMELILLLPCIFGKVGFNGIVTLQGLLLVVLLTLLLE